jgi:DNA-binding NtrC family response regulator
VLAGYVAADTGSQALLEQARKIALAPSTVLIIGESGTGKDLLAALIHYLGPNAGEPLVKIDCASLPAELMESELFGYERGAFTGAAQRKLGRLEMAGAGTLVLDEIASLTPAMQAKLLRVIEEKRFHRLGGSADQQVAARIIALTNTDLEDAMRRGSFRQDLFYRLNVVPLRLRPLRERTADIRPLARRLLAQLCELHGMREKKISAAALAALEQHPFPGNIRELRNLLERALVHGGSPEIRPADLDLKAAGRAAPRKSLAERERDYIAEVLDAVHGKKSKAAAILGISRKNLLEKRKRYKLD